MGVARLIKPLYSKEVGKRLEVALLVNHTRGQSKNHGIDGRGLIRETGPTQFHVNMRVLVYGFPSLIWVTIKNRLP